MVLVQQDGEQGLGAASVLDRLRGEEEVLRGGVVEGAVSGLAVGALLVRARRVLEQEDDAVYRAGVGGSSLRVSCWGTWRAGGTLSAGGWNGMEEWRVLIAAGLGVGWGKVGAVLFGKLNAPLRFQMVGVQFDEFFELHVLDAEVFE